MRTIAMSPLSRHHGLTLLEVVVVLVLCFVLFVMFCSLLPERRVTSRRAECLNNLKNVTLAASNFAASDSGRLPAIVLPETSIGPKGLPRHPNWPVALLPYLDRNDLVGQGRYFGNSGNPNSVTMRVLRCPAERSTWDQSENNSRLSYAVNAGAGDWLVDGSQPVWTETWNGPPAGRNHRCDLDWNGDGKRNDADLEIALSTGVFHRHSYDSAWPDPALRGETMIANPITLDWITARDGLATTLMVLENTNSRNWGYSDLTATSNGLVDTAIALSATVRGKNPYADISFGGPSGPLEIVKTSKPIGISWINSNIGTKVGQWPAPSSYHPGIVNAAFCDGHCQMLSETIDPTIYIRLLSANGTALGQAAISDYDF